MPTLKPRHDISAFREPVNNFTLALITPLRANYNHICHEGNSYELNLKE
jgi:hypothetical protein